MRGEIGRHVVSRSLLVVLALAVGACSDPTAKAPPDIKVQGDLYCDLAEKVRWSKSDTPETVRQVVRENAKIDRVCASGAPQRVARK